MSFTQIENFFYKTFNQFAAALTLSVVVAVVEFSPAVYKILANSDGSQNYGLGSTSQYIGGALNTLNAIPLAASLITALVWGLTGLLLYTVFYVLTNIIIDAKNEIYKAAENSVDGVSSSNILQHAGGKLTAAVSYMLFIGVSILYFFKVWMSLFYIYLYSGTRLVDLPYALGGFIGLLVNIYMAIVLAQLIWKTNEMV